MREEAEPRICRKDLLPPGGEGHEEEPGERGERGPRIARLAPLDDERRAHAEGDRGKQLIADSEERPERVDATEWVEHSLNEEVTPPRHDQRRCDHGARIPRRATHRLPDVPGELLQHEAADTRAGIDGREN